jgi:hypothetical protein
VRYREIELREREKHTGGDNGERAAEDERGGKKSNRHSPCSHARAGFAIDLLASIFAELVDLSSRLRSTGCAGAGEARGLDERSTPGTLAAKR